MAQQNKAMTREARKAAQTRNKRSKKPIKKKKPLWRRIIKWFLWLIVAGTVFGVGLFAYYAKDAPALSASKLESGQSLTIYAADAKTVLTKLGSENRTNVKSTAIPQQLKDAVVSIEDRRFYNEPFWIDPIRIASSAFYNLTHPNSDPQGGSTLTQQLVKLTYFSTKKSDQTLRRKAQEAWLAMQVERHFSKEQILEYYINAVYEANGIYGMGTAATYYYGKDLDKLTIAQTALIAGIPNSPNNYDPYVHPEAAKNRRDLVIQAMADNGKISASEAATAKATAIDTGLQAKAAAAGSNDNALVADAYIQEVIKAIKSKGYDPYRDNLSVVTNLDLPTQKYLYQLVNGTQIAFPDDLFQTGVTITDPNNGNVIAMIGNRKVGNVQMALNRATQTDRSNGSTIKPLLDYAPAFEYLDWSTAQKVEDTPYTYPGTNISLMDWDRKYLGTMTLRQALAVSRNIPAVRTLEEVGLTKASQFVSNLGIKIPSSAGLSVGIGANISTLQVASAYNAFANGGTYYKPQYIKKITTADKIEHDYTDSNEGTRAMKASTAYMITDVLKDVITNGSATSTAISGLYQAGKTGTTGYTDKEIAKNAALNNTVKDSWFAGYTKHYSIAVWTGYDKANQHGVANQTIAQLIYRYMMVYLSQKVSNSDWTMPSSVVSQGGELYVKGSEPDSATDDQTDESSSESSSSSSSESSTSSSAIDQEQPGNGESSSSSTTTTPTEPGGNDSSSSSSSPTTGGGNGGDTESPGTGSSSTTQ
ncbi:transglycosylase domain-containing protein [Lapidilactobacillus achengensis]|uniref:Transglycosylase domain-containing protein n=1 Tax=Lapidilactobacillus achengensis TaxID=2486000 RepID=A0ABW1UMT4_9LACO|nr:transglycosylase domain-containing protein [Lapidilactobacillus achengensis]